MSKPTATQESAAELRRLAEVRLREKKSEAGLPRVEGDAGSIKSILNAVAVIAVVLWLLNVFGVLGSLSRIHVGK